jgi:hypothetical protein
MLLFEFSVKISTFSVSYGIEEVISVFAKNISLYTFCFLIVAGEMTGYAVVINAVNN